jgi:hypothetical protein
VKTIVDRRNDAVRLLRAASVQLNLLATELATAAPEQTRMDQVARAVDSQDTVLLDAVDLLRGPGG